MLETDLKQEAIDDEKEVVSPSKARFRNHFSIGHKQYKRIVREQYTKLKIAGLLISLLSIVGLIILAIFQPDYMIYSMGLVLLPTILIVYIFITILLFLKKIDSKIRSRSQRINYDIHFYKDNFVVESYIYEDKFKTQVRSLESNDSKVGLSAENLSHKNISREVINYSKVTRLVEAKSYIYIITKEKIYFFNKKARFKKHKNDTIDTFRKYLQEKTHLYIYIASYCPGRLYESYYEIDYQLTLQENTSYFLIFLSTIATLSPIAFNFFPEVKYQYMWLFWLGAVICVIDLVAILLMNYRTSHVNWRIHTTTVLSFIGIVISFAFGIHGTIIKQNEAATADSNRILEHLDISLPEHSKLVGNTELSCEIDTQIFYRKEIVQEFTDENEIISFAEEISQNNQLWLSEFNTDNMQVLPTNFNQESSDYFFMYDEISQLVNPTYLRVKNNAIMWLFSYDIDQNLLVSINYNIVDETMYS